MSCDACGHDVPPDARFCPNCGTAVAEHGKDDHRGDDSGAAAEAAEASEGSEATEATEATATEPTAKRSTVVTVLGNVLAVAAGGTLGAVAGWLIVRAM